MRNRDWAILVVCVAYPAVAQAEPVMEVAETQAPGVAPASPTMVSAAMRPPSSVRSFDLAAPAGKPSEGVSGPPANPVFVAGPPDMAAFNGLNLAALSRATAATSDMGASDQVVGTSSVAAGPAKPKDLKFSAFLTVGTLGLGPEIRYRFAPNWGVRGSLTYIGFGLDAEIDGISYDGDLRLGSGGVAVDYFFSATSTWHISAGLRYNSNAYNIQFRPRNNVQIGNGIYTPAQIGNIKGRIEGDWQFSPTLSFGKIWGGDRGVQFGFELGAMFHKTLQVKSLEADGLLGKAAEFLRDLALERRGIDSDLDVLNVFPIAQILVGFKF